MVGPITGTVSSSAFQGARAGWGDVIASLYPLLFSSGLQQGLSDRLFYSLLLFPSAVFTLGFFSVVLKLFTHLTLIIITFCIPTLRNNYLSTTYTIFTPPKIIKVEGQVVLN